MAKLPEPPDRATLQALGADLIPVPAGTRLWRLYFQGGTHPTTWSAFRHFGPVHARFDHHLSPPAMQHRGVLYLATAPLTCLAEVYQAARLIDRSAGMPALVAFPLTRPLVLLNLAGLWPTRAGASMALSTGQHARTQRWSAAIYDAFPSVDGLWYASSMCRNDPAMALYERSYDARPHHPVFHRRLDAVELDTVVRNAAADLNYRLT